MDLMRVSNLNVIDRIQGASLELKAGEVMGLIGPNGSGKSSLLNTLAGLLEWTGEIVINGRDIKGLGDFERARKVALQPQFSESAWSLSVHDVVSMGRLPWGDSDQAIIRQAMQQANVMELARRPVDQLSGGEKARVWLARVLANQPDVLLVDEPVANLDIHYQRDVMSLLRAYAREGNAVFIAIHDLSLAAKYCDRLCLLNEGHLVKVGQAEEVLNTQILQAVFKVEVVVNLESETPFVIAK